MQVNTSNWHAFKISDIFETQSKGKKLQVPTGANVPVKDLVENGSTPRITATGINNGIYGFYDYCGNKQKDYRVFNNFISVSFLGTVFYQENEASLDMKIHCLKPKDVTLNKYTGHFLVSAIKSSLKKSSYADQISSTVLPLMVINLPVDDKGNPDWKYMEQYIKNFEVKANTKINNLQDIKKYNRHKINITNWTKYHLYDIELFYIDAGTKMDKVKMTDNNPTINFVGRANNNNGVTMCVDRTDDVPYKAGYMTLSLGGEYLGSCFIQDKEFYTSQNVVVLIPKWDMPDTIKQFIAASVFKEARSHYKAFDDELNRHIKTDFSFYLPTVNNHPDWEYMDNYMKRLEVKANIIIDSLYK